MISLRKWWKPALAILALVVVGQIGASLLARTSRVHNYLVKRLEQSFGRTVEVRHFIVVLLPRPMLDAEQVTIGEDPAFGHEYFLRADRLTAGLRWGGLLRGHFDFGTLSLTRPSLILARNEEGSWNLERWLPPAKRLAPDAVRAYGPQLAANSSNRLQKIAIDDGRINFKSGDEKLPFAFLAVSGSVEQVASGRWRLHLEAQPWRSGVPLQSTGTVMVEGDVAGTSARLQPAAIHIQWDKASLADVFRLFRGDDYGVRGSLTLDATAKSGSVNAGIVSDTQPGDWSFSMQARASEIHRWDLTERRDNPGVNVNVEGHWNVPNRTVVAQHVSVETALSNLRGTAQLSAMNSPASWMIRVDSAGIQATDLLAWYRAFRPEVNERISAQQFFTGAMTLRGWPLEVEDAAFSSNGGEVRIPGLNAPLHVGAFTGGRSRAKLVVEPIRVAYSPLVRSQQGALSSAAPLKRRGAENRTAVEIGFVHDFEKRAGSIAINGHVDRIEDVLAVTAAFGRPLNRGWELSGSANAALHWNWDPAPTQARWYGRLEVADGLLQVAGLNRPLDLNKARLEWRDGLRTASIDDADGFGASWSGQIAQAAATDADGNVKWNFQLHADHLDAAALDLWIGPRARPNWLQRVLTSLFGEGSSPSASAASALVRRVNAEGELRVDEFTLERIKLSQVRARGSLRDLHLEVRDADAQWAGGKIRARLAASFLPRPVYNVVAELDRVDLARLPQFSQAPDRFAGIASGTLRLAAQGVGRDELLARLTGRGDVKLRDVEFRGWDVSASVADGEPREGASRWTSGEASFMIRDEGVILAGLRLDSGGDRTLIKGTVKFSQDTDLTIQMVGDPLQQSGSPQPYVLRISGPLDLPRVSIEKLVARQPAD